LDDELDIVVTAFDAEPRQAEAALVRVFGIEPQSARRMLRALPVVARRAVPAPLAQRYLAALTSIGAQAELRPSTNANPSTRPAAGASLPAPSPSAVARLRESLRLERAADDAIARFRSEEGLDGEERAPDSLEELYPAIPRAPALPRDLGRMPNAAAPRRSDPPGWTMPLAQMDDGPGNESVPARAHVDAQRPPPQAPPGPARAAAVRTSPSPRPSSQPPQVGLAHAATASVRPGLSSVRPVAPAKSRSRWTWTVAPLVALTLLWMTGVLDTDQGRRIRALRREGVEPGTTAEAGSWLELASHEVDGIDKRAARELLARAMRAGARGVYAVRIHDGSGGAERAGGLVIELPDESVARRTIFWHVQRALGPEHSLLSDHGQRFCLLVFPAVASPAR
jgi:hypothetical protein